MNQKESVSNKDQFNGAPIERAHLHRGFASKKTPLKWIRFFRACVKQREYANDERKKKIKNIWVAAFTAIIMAIFINLFFPSPILFLIPISICIALIINYRANRSYNTKYANGFDFFSDYFSSFFTLIEEDLLPQSRISLEANVKDTIDPKNLIKKEAHESNTSGFLSGKNYYYEREISKGTCLLSDGCALTFNFTERLRNRVVTKRGAISGKRKTKQKYKSVYPFILKMKIPKARYSLNPAIDKAKIQLAEDADFYIVKTTRKFDIKNENPEKYEPYESRSIEMFSSDYFALELINLINVSYSCITPKA